MKNGIIGLDLNKDSLPKLIVMCGLQCSGKSTKAKELASKYEAEIISSDQLRLDHPDYDNQAIFKLLYSRVNNLLYINKNIVIDATNTTIKMRKQIFNNVKQACYKMCYIMNTPYEECLNRLNVRNNSFYPHKVPEEVLEKYYYSFEVPFYEEGWNEIIIDKSFSFYDSFINSNKLRLLTFGFNQNNRHHTQDLGSHMDSVGSNLSKYSNQLLTDSGYMHDIGKLFTQTYKENDPNAHYYNHANVGAYVMLCNFSYWEMKDHFSTAEYDMDKTLDFIFYINYHMHLYNIKSDKSEKKWRQIFGDNKYNNLIMLNEADKANHVGDKNE